MVSEIEKIPTIMDIKNGVGPSKVFVKNPEKTNTYVIDFLV